MKKARIRFFTLCAVVLFVCSAAPLWAYTFTVSNAIDDMGAEWAQLYVTISWAGGSHDFGTLQKGQTQSYANTDWKTKGLCWDDITVSHPDWAGCGHKDVANSHKILFKCQDTKVVLKRTGCNIDFYVE